MKDASHVSTHVSCYSLLHIQSNASDYDIHEAYLSLTNNRQSPVSPDVWSAYQLALELYHFQQHNFDRPVPSIHELKTLRDQF